MSIQRETSKRPLNFRPKAQHSLGRDVDWELPEYWGLVDLESAGEDLGESGKSEKSRGHAK